MYTAKSIAMTDSQQQHQFIQQFSFGLMVCESLTATHLPFILAKRENGNDTLYTHMAKANHHWREIENSPALVVFNGPHSYISPTWYHRKPAVPTWNYAAVHVKGKARVSSAQQTLQTVENSIRQFEPSLSAKNDIITESFRDKLLQAIVGIEIDIAMIEGKQKLGQERSVEDQKGVYQALSQSPDLASRMLANYMEEVELGTGN